MFHFSKRKKIHVPSRLDCELYIKSQHFKGSFLGLLVGTFSGWQNQTVTSGYHNQYQFDTVLVLLGDTTRIMRKQLLTNPHPGGDCPAKEMENLKNKHIYPYQSTIPINIWPNVVSSNLMYSFDNIYCFVKVRLTYVYFSLF